MSQEFWLPQVPCTSSTGSGCAAVGVQLQSFAPTGARPSSCADAGALVSATVAIAASSAIPQWHQRFSRAGIRRSPFRQHSVSGGQHSVCGMPNHQVLRSWNHWGYRSAIFTPVWRGRFFR
ncbi:hypothetical protein IU431_04145 [Nocardia otitidiscaviarum]|uniref:hypothetical protein n=1 Tax=Nocardia otitidiscaviarum TaxID=1823 RepID=UPI001893ACF2|nr:hypothetical protein [Nocardia otitidiscaviarum]